MPVRGKIPVPADLPFRKPVPIVVAENPVPVFQPIRVEEPMIVVKTIVDPVELEIPTLVPEHTVIPTLLFQPRAVEEEMPITVNVTEAVDQPVRVPISQFAFAPGEEVPVEEELGVFPDMPKTPPLRDIPVMPDQPEFDFDDHFGRILEVNVTA
jgi:hypothetical protein